MDLLSNPFYILGATPSDSRKRIVQLADDCSLLDDPDGVADARSTLTTPRRRLTAEIAWLPGCNREVVFLQLLKETPWRILEVPSVHSLPEADIGKSNLLAAGMKRQVEDAAPEYVARWILALAEAFEVVQVDALMEVINEARIEAGFPEATRDLVAAELKARREYFRKLILECASSMDFDDWVYVVTAVAESATNLGEYHAPVLADDLIDAYIAEAQPVLTERQDVIRQNYCRRLLTRVKLGIATDEELEHLLTRIVTATRQWDDIAQPIQISYRSRGLEHADSLNLAAYLRWLALTLYNEHERKSIAVRLLRMLEGVFAEIDEYAERFESDLSRILSDTSPAENLSNSSSKLTQSSVSLRLHPDKLEKGTPFRILLEFRNFVAKSIVLPEHPYLQIDATPMSTQRRLESVDGCTIGVVENVFVATFTSYGLLTIPTIRATSENGGVLQSEELEVFVSDSVDIREDESSQPYKDQEPLSFGADYTPAGYGSNKLSLSLDRPLPSGVRASGRWLFGAAFVIAVLGMCSVYDYSSGSNPTGSTIGSDRQSPGERDRRTGVPRPFSGATRILALSETGVKSRVAPLELRANAGSDYLVKLETLGGQSVLDVYVHAGSSTEVLVPLGSYRVKYAAGTEWYGYEQLFGPRTSYSIADSVFTFRDEGTHYTGYTVTLYQVRGGNLRTRGIRAEDF